MYSDRLSLLFSSIWLSLAGMNVAEALLGCCPRPPPWVNRLTPYVCFWVQSTRLPDHCSPPTGLWVRTYPLVLLYSTCDSANSCLSSLYHGTPMRACSSRSQHVKVVSGFAFFMLVEAIHAHRITTTYTTPQPAQVRSHSSNDPSDAGKTRNFGTAHNTPPATGPNKHHGATPTYSPR